MTIEIVDLPIENGGSFHSYVKLPEGIYISRLFFGHVGDEILSLHSEFLPICSPGDGLHLPHRRRLILGWT